MRTVLVCVRTPLAAQTVASTAARLGMTGVVRTAVSETEAMIRLAERPAEVVLADTAITRPDSVGFTRRVLARAQVVVTDFTRARGGLARVRHPVAAHVRILLIPRQGADRPGTPRQGHSRALTPRPQRHQAQQGSKDPRHRGGPPVRLGEDGSPSCSVNPVHPLPRRPPTWIVPARNSSEGAATCNLQAVRPWVNTLP